MWLWVAAAFACDTPYAKDALAADMGAAETGLREMDDVGFGAAVRRMEDNLACLDGVVAPAAFAATYRLIGAGHWLLRDDGIGAGRWFRAAAELDPRYDWDVGEIPLNHPMRRAWETERPAADDVPEPVEGMELTAGVWTMDGRPLTRPAATPARPHVLQRVAADGAVQTWAIYGNAFPKEALGAPAPVAVAPAAVPTRGFEAVTVRRERPPAKTPLLLTGAAGILAAGGVYGASFATRAAFEGSTTTQDVHRNAAVTNTLVVGSGGLLVAGMAIGGWAIAL